MSLDMNGLRAFYGDIRAAVDAEKIPGAVMLAGRRGETLFFESCGCAQWLPAREPMTKDTSFDVASLSKMTGAWPGILLLLQEGRLSLTDTMADMLGERPMHPDLWDVTLWNLLTHTAGLVPFHQPAEFGESREARVNGLLSLPPVKPRGAQVLYSDLSFIFLGEILSKYAGKPLDQAAGEIFQRLGMDHTGYNPTPDTYCAATEFRPGRTDYPVRGTVHDETSEMLGGVAGHAGVFSTAEDLGRFLTAIIPDDPNPLFERDWLLRSFTNQTGHLGDTRALGWICYRIRPEGNIVGHTGFTGTSMWLDTATGEYVVLLTNRVHPTRNNDTLFPLRREGFRKVFGVGIMM